MRVIVSILVLVLVWWLYAIFASDVMRYDRRTPELSNAPLHMKQEISQQCRLISSLILRQDIDIDLGRLGPILGHTWSKMSLVSLNTLLRDPTASLLNNNEERNLRAAYMYINLSISISISINYRYVCLRVDISYQLVYWLVMGDASGIKGCDRRNPGYLLHHST